MDRTHVRDTASSPNCLQLHIWHTPCQMPTQNERHGELPCSLLGLQAILAQATPMRVRGNRIGQGRG